MGDRKRGDASFLILKYLGDNGPASYEKISKDLGIPQSTVENRIRKILIKRHGLVRKLSNDKLALIWYTDDEETAKILKRKLLRNPRPEELAGLIKKSPSEARDLLFKYIPGYREPTQEEILSSAKVLWKTIVLGITLPSKNDLFKRGITKAIFIGLDPETLNDIWAKECSSQLCCDYLNGFPEMKPEITSEENGDKIKYEVKWSDDVKDILHEINSWRETVEIYIPLKLDDKTLICGQSPSETIQILDELAEIYAPSPPIIYHLLKLIGYPSIECDVLIVLRKFCRTALELEILDENILNDIIRELKDVAFTCDSMNLDRHYENEEDSFKERNYAFEIIEMLDIRNQEVIDLAKDYVLKEIRELSSYENILGPNISKVAKWLARDPSLKTEIMEKINEALVTENDEYSLGLCAILVKNIR